jgi:hypothetical protein
MRTSDFAVTLFRIISLALWLLFLGSLLKVVFVDQPRFDAHLASFQRFITCEEEAKASGDSWYEKSKACGDQYDRETRQ